MREVETSPDLSDESDEDLLVYVALDDEDLDPPEKRLVQRAQREFYGRHFEWLRRTLMRHKKELRRLYGDKGAALHASETLRKGFENADTYDTAQANQDDARRRVRAWLGRIAYNLLMDKLRALDEDVTVLTMKPGDLSRRPLPEPHPPPSSEEHELICEALDQLNEREQFVMRMTVMYQKTAEKGERVPPYIAHWMADVLDTSVENIRTIRRRAREKFFAYLEEHS